LYYSLSIINRRVLKSRGMTWAAYMEGSLTGKPKEKSPFGKHRYIGG
jgi:hypothetical protein